jgi:hypothetical protein
MPASKVSPRPKLRLSRAKEIAALEGLTTQVDLSAFYGVTQSQWSRVTNPTGKRKAEPGAGFIAAVLSSPAAQKYPALVTFDNLFEVVTRAEVVAA